MILIINALLPVFGLILLGYILKKKRFPTQDFWPLADKLTYYILVPALLFYSLVKVKVELRTTINLIYISSISAVIVLVILIVSNFVFKFNGKFFTSIVQGGLRFNSYIFFALMDAFFSTKGVIVASVLIPLKNIICVVVFSLYAPKYKNSCCWYYHELDILSRVALPMGILSVGVGLELSHIKKAKKELLWATLTKLLIYPLVAYSISLLFSATKEELIIIMIFATMPTAISSFILARELGGDTKLMAAIISLKTLLAIFTSMIILFLVI